MLARLFKGLAERYESWREWRRAYEELNALDDRSLADIGIARSDIPYILAHRTEAANDAAQAKPASTLRHAA